MEAKLKSVAMTTYYQGCEFCHDAAKMLSCYVDDMDLCETQLVPLRRRVDSLVTDTIQTLGLNVKVCQLSCSGDAANCTEVEGDVNPKAADGCMKNLTNQMEAKLKSGDTLMMKTYLEGSDHCDDWSKILECFPDDDNVETMCAAYEEAKKFMKLLGNTVTDCQWACSDVSKVRHGNGSALPELKK